MKKITYDSVYAFLGVEKFKRGNMEIKIENGIGDTKISCMYLNDNCIAKMFDNGSIEISNAGWETATMKDRLNGVLYGINRIERIYQKEFNWYWRDKEPFPYNQWIRV